MSMWNGAENADSIFTFNRNTDSHLRSAIALLSRHNVIILLAYFNTAIPSLKYYLQMAHTYYLGYTK